MQCLAEYKLSGRITDVRLDYATARLEMICNYDVYMIA